MGGWYDERARVSITQREYREAYRLHRQGRLKLLTFVRSEVWQMREERKQLAKHLDGMGLEPAQCVQIVNYPSKSAADAEFISAFIAEVSRNETREAREAGVELPYLFSASDFVASHLPDPESDSPRSLFPKYQVRD